MVFYWFQEATTMGGQDAASYPLSAALFGGLVTAVVGLVGVLIGQYLTQKRHDETSMQTAQRHNETLMQTAQLETERAHEAALRKYFEDIGRLLVEGKLRPPQDQQASDEQAAQDLRVVARAQTFAVLQGLDPKRKRILLQFLHEARLIERYRPLISLAGADLGGADLRSADLRGADLRNAAVWEADLGEADLREATLREADLTLADLEGADLTGVDLEGANLAGAELREADLVQAKLKWANLGGADLGGANLSGAELWGVDLREAILRGADLREAILRRAFLSGAFLSGADLSGADLRNTVGLTQAQIEEGTLGDPNTKLPPDLQHPKAWFDKPG